MTETLSSSELILTMGEAALPSIDAASSYIAIKRGVRNDHLRSHRPRRPCKTIVIRRLTNSSLETIPEYPSRLRLFHVMIISVFASAMLALQSQTNWLVKPLDAKMHRQLVELRPEHLEQYPFNSFIDTSDPTPEYQKHVTGFFWHVPRAGGKIRTLQR